jgi:hypothetical protein
MPSGVFWKLQGGDLHQRRSLLQQYMRALLTDAVHFAVQHHGYFPQPPAPTDWQYEDGEVEPKVRLYMTRAPTDLAVRGWGAEGGAG